MKKTLIVLGLIALALGIGFMARTGESATQTATITHLKGTSYMNTFTTTPGALLIDVRTPQEYAQGHLAGAINIDIEAPTFIDEIKKLDPSTPTFVYCRSGNRSGQAIAIMKKLGFTSLTDLSGGIVGSPELLEK